MVFDFAHSVNIHRSILNDIAGDYNHYNIVPGERGIADLFKASCSDASHDSQARLPPPRCHPATRTAILEEIWDWIHNRDERILWLSGPAGAGKSAIAQNIAEECANTSVLAASFFFFHSDSNRNTDKRLISSIVYQLAIRMHHKRTRIGNIIEDDPSILHKSPEAQIKTLILPLFSAGSFDDTSGGSPDNNRLPFLIIVDGLDECEGDNNQRYIIHYLGNLANAAGIPLRFMIVSRPEPPINEAIRRLSYPVYHISLADPLRIRQAEYDIHVYLRQGFNEIYKKHEMTTQYFWPGDDIISILVEKSGGNFIYPSIVLKYVDDEDFMPVERLNEVLDTPPGLTPFAEIDYLYRRIIGASPNVDRVLLILTCALLWNSWVHRIELILGFPTGTVKVALRRMQSILQITSSSNDIHFYHKSFEDFIHSKERSQEYFIDPEVGYARLASEFLKFIQKPMSTCDDTAQFLREQIKDSWKICLKKCKHHIACAPLLEELWKNAAFLVAEFSLLEMWDLLRLLKVHKNPSSPSKYSSSRFQMLLFEKYLSQSHKYLENHKAIENPMKYHKDISKLLRRQIHRDDLSPFYTLYNKKNVIDLYHPTTVIYAREKTFPLYLRPGFLRSIPVSPKGNFWKQYLPFIRPGDQKVLNVLKMLGHSVWRILLDPEEFKMICSWLKLSGIALASVWKYLGVKKIRKDWTIHHTLRQTVQVTVGTDQKRRNMKHGFGGSIKWHQLGFRLAKGYTPGSGCVRQQCPPEYYYIPNT